MSRRSLEALADGAAEADLAVVDADVEAAVGVGAHPRLVGDGGAFAAVVRQRHQDPLVALLALRVLAVVRHDSLPIPLKFPHRAQTHPPHTRTAEKSPQGLFQTSAGTARHRRNCGRVAGEIPVSSAGAGGRWSTRGSWPRRPARSRTRLRSR